MAKTKISEQYDSLLKNSVELTALMREQKKLLIQITEVEEEIRNSLESGSLQNYNNLLQTRQELNNKIDDLVNRTAKIKGELPTLEGLNKLWKPDADNLNAEINAKKDAYLKSARKTIESYLSYVETVKSAIIEYEKVYALVPSDIRAERERAGLPIFELEGIVASSDYDSDLNLSKKLTLDEHHHIDCVLNRKLVEDN